MSLPQHMEALGVANDTRLARTAFRKDLRSRPNPEAWALLARVLEQPPDWLGNMYAVDLLQFPKSIGPGLSDKFMEAADVIPSRRVRELTERQRRELAECLRGNTREVRDRAVGRATYAREWFRQNAA